MKYFFNSFGFISYLHLSLQTAFADEASANLVTLTGKETVIYTVLTLIFLFLVFISLLHFFKIKVTREKTGQLKTKGYLLNISAFADFFPLTIFVTDLDGNIEFANQKCIDSSGYSKEELLGKTSKIFRSNIHPESFYTEIWNNISAGQTWTGEITSLKKSGKTHWQHLTVFPLKNDEKEIIGYLFIKENIGKEKSAHISLKQQNSELVIARETIANMEKDLKHARKSAELAFQTKDKFLENVSHEIRTPLNSLVGMSYILKKTNLSDEQDKYLSKILSASQKLLGIIENILDLSKAESDQIKIDKMEFDLNKLFKDIGQLILHKVPQEQKLVTFYDIDSSIPAKLLGDPLRLQQILNNLIDHSIQSTNEGEILLSMKTVQKKKNTILIRFTVKDTGTGLTKEQKAQLLAPFHQADTSVTSQTGNIWLGLTITQSLIQLMGGKLDIESTLNKGTTFSFDLNFPYSSDQEDPGTHQFNQTPEPQILLSIQQPTLKEIVTSQLNQTSAIMTVINSPADITQEAYCNQTKRSVDIIIIDYLTTEYFIPSILVKHLHSQGAKKIPHILLLSPKGYTVWEGEAEASLLSASLLFPFTGYELFHQINNLLDTEKVTSKADLPTFETRQAQVLLVEDSPINQQLMQGLLEDHYLQVDLASNGLEAIEKVKNSVYDLVLMDINMPLLDGYKATEKIRKELGISLEQLPIIALTADDNIINSSQFSNAGMNDFILKPVHPNQISKLLSRWLGSKMSSFTANKKININWPDKVPGINLLKGLQFSSGKKDLYTKLLLRFLDQATTLDKIQNAIDQNDQQHSLHLIHTLKGISGNIGAFQLREHLIEVEKKLQTDHSNTSTLSLEKVEEEMKRVFLSINQLDLISSDQVDHADSRIPPENKDALDLFEELRVLISQNNTEALVKLHEIMKEFPYYREPLQPVSLALKKYDFAKAGKNFNILNLG